MTDETANPDVIELDGNAAVEAPTLSPAAQRAKEAAQAEAAKLRAEQRRNIRERYAQSVIAMSQAHILEFAASPPSTQAQAVAIERLLVLFDSLVEVLTRVHGFNVEMFWKVAAAQADAITEKLNAPRTTLEQISEDATRL